MGWHDSVELRGSYPWLQLVVSTSFWSAIGARVRFTYWINIVGGLDARPDRLLMGLESLVRPSLLVAELQISYSE